MNFNWFSSNSFWSWTKLLELDLSSFIIDFVDRNLNLNVHNHKTLNALIFIAMLLLAIKYYFFFWLFLSRFSPYFSGRRTTNCFSFPFLYYLSPIFNHFLSHHLQEKFVFTLKLEENWKVSAFDKSKVRWRQNACSFRCAIALTN